MATRILRRTERPLVTSTLARRVAQFVLRKKEIEGLTAENNALKADLMSEVERAGYTDEKGSLFLDLPEPVAVGDQVVTQLKRERRVSRKFLDDKARALLTKKNLYDADKVRALEEAIEALIESTDQPVAVHFSVELDQDAIFTFNQTKVDGKKVITDGEVDKLFEDTETWAFKPLTG